MRHEDINTTMKYVNISDKVLKDHYDEYQENFEK
ncbi:MAG: hypothetical protein BTN85_0991 [Candidatus Methanohalarchaeum thermophilum]|uniref:Uncharacterized protein n=1 Tax=Methanohalarchaeum thermophilum TaxID=1903181 RepID=A0A1Q6DVU3_METT1|nr:MAG: hypothetical protein BTN85_0991 [Candidatus Methanohalarchaeum thermophilum]